MNKVYVLSYISKRAHRDYVAGRPFSVPLSGYYRGHKITECVISELDHNVLIADNDLEKIAIMKLSLFGVEKNRILGKLGELNFF